MARRSTHRREASAFAAKARHGCRNLGQPAPDPFEFPELATAGPSEYRIIYFGRRLLQSIREGCGLIGQISIASLVLLRIRVALAVRGYKKTLDQLDQLPLKAGTAAELDECLELCRIVNAVGMRLGSKCLERSLAARSLLKRKGVDARLVIGVCRDHDGEFRAHAWLDHRGVVINDLAKVTREFETIHDPGVKVH